MRTYTENLLSNFSFNINVETFTVINTGFGEPLKLRDIPYSQMIVDLPEMESIMKETNSIADNVTLFYKDESGKRTLSSDEYHSVKPDIVTAIKTVIDNLTNVNFLMNDVNIIHDEDPENSYTGLNLYKYINQQDGYETIVYFTYIPHMLSSDFIELNNPDSVINDFEKLEY